MMQYPFSSLSLIINDNATSNIQIYVSYIQVLREFNRPMVFSISPGTSVTLNMAKTVNGLVNMYRITGDDWDKWNDVAAHFEITR